MICLASFTCDNPSGGSSIAVTISRSFWDNIPKFTGATRWSFASMYPRNRWISSWCPVTACFSRIWWASLSSCLIACAANVCSSRLGETASTSPSEDGNLFSRRLLSMEWADNPELREDTSSSPRGGRLGVCLGVCGCGSWGGVKCWLGSVGSWAMWPPKKPQICTMRSSLAVLALAAAEPLRADSFFSIFPKAVLLPSKNLRHCCQVQSGNRAASVFQRSSFTFLRANCGCFLS